MTGRRLLGPVLLAAATLTVADPAFADCARERFAVAIDVGHTRARPGAISAHGRPEFAFNLTLAEDLLTGLRAAGFTASFAINADGRIASLQARTAAARQRAAAVLLSIHHDSVQPRYLAAWAVDGRKQRYSDSFRGYSLFISSRNPAARESLTLATLLGQALRVQGLTPTLHHAEPIAGENRLLLDAELGIYRFDNLVVLRSAAMPAVLLEAGVIVHREEEQLLRDPSYRARFVSAATQALEAYCKQVSF